MTKNLFYNCERRIVLQIDNKIREFYFIALSAESNEAAIVEAQRNHAKAIQQLFETADSMRRIYLLQDSELLAEAVLNAEHDKFLAKAALTLTGNEADYRRKVEAKAKILMDARHVELFAASREQLADRLVSLEIDKQTHNVWAYAVLEATLVRVLHDENRQIIFSSANEMKAAVSPHILEKFYEVLIEFLEESGNVQVFLKPHTLKG